MISQNPKPTTVSKILDHKTGRNFGVNRPFDLQGPGQTFVTQFEPPDGLVQSQKDEVAARPFGTPGAKVPAIFVGAVVHK